MSILDVVDPVRMYIRGYEDRLGELQTGLTYVDKKVYYLIQRHRHAHWFRRKYGEEAYQEKMKTLKAERKKCLLFIDEEGMWTYSGLKSFVESIVRSDEIRSQIEYPEPKLMAWDAKPVNERYPYQFTATEKMLHHRHCAVELATGLGKTFIILHLVKELGLKTLVMAPSLSIAEQIRDLFIEHFGRRRVGQFFDGRKEVHKLITVGIPQSLIRIEEDSPEQQALSQVQVFIADESHLCPAQTLANVCFGLMKAAPYRFFFSGTQMRNDGLDTLLGAITGPVVLRMTVREGVDHNPPYLAKPVFRMVKTFSQSPFRGQDVNDMTRTHLYYNPVVVSQAALIANNSVAAYGHPVLILVDEIEQFVQLLPQLRHRVGFAHGPLDAENKGKVPDAYHVSEPNFLVREFNNLRLPILVGTSCISTGTDVQAVKTMINLRGGKSEIEVRQSVGRCTRLHKPGEKIACNIFDFDVANVEPVSRHAKFRKKVYEEIYGPVEDVDWRMSLGK